MPAPADAYQREQEGGWGQEPGELSQQLLSHGRVSVTTANPERGTPCLWLVAFAKQTACNMSRLAIQGLCLRQWSHHCNMLPTTMQSCQWMRFGSASDAPQPPPPNVLLLPVCAAGRSGAAADAPAGPHRQGRVS